MRYYAFKRRRLWAFQLTALQPFAESWLSAKSGSIVTVGDAGICVGCGTSTAATSASTYHASDSCFSPTAASGRRGCASGKVTGNSRLGSFVSAFVHRQS
jgi:hypothetical protein